MPAKRYRVIRKITYEGPLEWIQQSMRVHVDSIPVGPDRRMHEERSEPRIVTDLFEIECKPMAGTYIGAVAREVAAIAQELGREVVFEFNARRVTVQPEWTAKEVVEKWEGTSAS